MSTDDVLRQYALSDTVCETFRRIGRRVPVRFGRTAKVKKQFVGELVDITWTYCKRKGGGFTCWVVYKGLAPRSHHVILKEMLADYTHYTHELIDQGHELKRIKNDSINPSKDLDIYTNGGWVPLGTFFPIQVRELHSSEVCERWARENGANTDMDICHRILQDAYGRMREILYRHHTV